MAGVARDSKNEWVVVDRDTWTILSSHPNAWAANLARALIEAEAIEERNLWILTRFEYEQSTLTGQKQGGS